MAMQSISEIEAAVDQSKRIIAISLCESKDLVAFYEGLLDFFIGMQGKGFELIFLNYNPSGSNYLRLNGFSKIFEFNPDETEQLFFVELFLVFDWNSIRYKFPATSKVVQLAHFFSADFDICSYMKSYGLRADYTFLVRANIVELEKRRRQLSRVASIGYPYKMLRAKGCLIPGGYPEFDALINKIDYRKSEYSGESGKILFATTGAVNDRLLAEHGSEVIRTLLDTFPTYDVVFRPAPSDRNHCRVIELQNAFTCHPRFFTDAGELSNTMRDCSIIIADSTALKEVFSLVKAVPYIHCDFSESNCKITKHELGYKVNNERDMISLARQILKGEHLSTSCIEKYLANPGRSATYLLDNINFILEDTINPEWFYYQNVNAGKPIEKPEDYYVYIANYIKSTCVKSWSLRIVDFALEEYPDSAFLLGIKSKILFYMGEFEQARAVFNKANALNSHEVAQTIDVSISGNIDVSLRQILKFVLPSAVVRLAGRVLFKLGL